MPLAGYRDLDTLKARLLPAGMGEEWEYDRDLADIGKGVAASFDRFTGRKLRRTVGAVHECSADQASIVIGSYPIETITSVSLLDGAGESNVTGNILSTQKLSGIIHFGGAIADSIRTLRVVSTGGYWCEDAETNEEMPAGATPLPDDLLQAWYHQVRAVCEAENIFRSKGAGRPSDKKAAATVDFLNLALLDGVKATLQLYIRIG